MNKKHILKEKLNIELTEKQIELFVLYEQYFLQENSKVNLISKNDEKFLFEKHIFDSLAFNLISSKYKKNIKLLDFGTGGGFPAIPIAILYPDIEVFPLDSIGKKLSAIQNISNKLGLKNVHIICDRIENIDLKFDVITARAVANLDKLINLSYLNLNETGIFVFYKSLKYKQELADAQKTIKRFKLKLIKNIE